MRRLTMFAAFAGGAACLIPNPEYDPSANSGSATGGAPTTAATTGGLSDGAETTGGSHSAGTMGGGTSGAAPCQSDAQCDDGVFCNGAEACDPGSPDADPAGCIAGAAPCGADSVCQEAEMACASACEVDPDGDNDGVDSVACGGTDCDDSNPGVHPGQPEVCDPAGVDEDCDPATLGHDADGDGLIGSGCCNLVTGALVCGPDCDDSQEGFGIGDWAHCSSCGNSCGAQHACIAGECVDARRVFVTSTTHDANFGGLGGADAACQARADAAGLGGVFKAYMLSLADGFARLAKPNVRFVRLDGVVVADDWAALALPQGNIKAPLRLTETRKTVEGNAWTGIGESSNFTCDDWTTAQHGCLDDLLKPCAVAGESTETDTDWNGQYKFDCDEQFRLYCIEQ